MVRQSAARAAEGGGNRQQSRLLDESDAATPTPTPSTSTTTAVKDEDAASASTKKRKLGGASGRGVANLTPEQLAKKRANDREAQRAIRERTKNQIQTLERRIEELTGLQPYQELQAALEAKSAVERENVEMRQRLASIVGMLQPLIGQLPKDTPAASMEQQRAENDDARETTELDRRTHSPPRSRQQPKTTTTTTTTTTGCSTPADINGHQAAQRLSDLGQQREQLRHGLDMGPERLGLGFLLDAGHQVSRIDGGGAVDADGSPTTFRYPALYTQQQGQQPHTPSVAGSASASPGPSTVSSTYRPPPPPQSSYSSHAFPSGYPYRGPQSTADDYDEEHDNYDDNDAASNADEPIDAGNGATIPRYAAPLRTTPPTCPLDALLLDFLHERRQRAAEGRPAHEVLGPRYPSVSSLLNPARRAHPLSRVFTDILAAFPALSGLPERVAVLYVMFLLMRWQVAPTRANYDRLPPWARPLRAQLRDPPHPPWVDHLPFPRMRAALLSSGGGNGYPAFDRFAQAYTATLSLSWPYRDTDALLQSPNAAADDADELLINPVFERHLRNLDNWKLGGAFARAFPALAEAGNVPEAELAAARAAQSPEV
ncbi:bZIP transcription factor [Cordyceps fumosorosea ARSEF 2679]|uniref:BZIP transcription factor n=1 Tax=Cordyceps fumosorosea (strain ARSEF 2679) TaxID=1081104 RepID=A0A168CC60_CORFA|nr:bZIP transcription factor [Cordyceps fumosorosea ARSEF 2679]OAA71210.1 bZIP transcription factor [Cordyceps fumosorosea ARSEF 2679]